MRVYFQESETIHNKSPNRGSNECVVQGTARQQNQDYLIAKKRIV